MVWWANCQPMLKRVLQAKKNECPCQIRIAEELTADPGVLIFVSRGRAGAEH